MRHGGKQSPKPGPALQMAKFETKIVEDENYVDWNFLQGGSGETNDTTITRCFVSNLMSSHFVKITK